MNSLIRMGLTLGLAIILQVQAQDPPRSIALKVDGLVCAFCAQGISKTISKMEASDEVLVSLENGLVAIALKPDQDIPDEALREALINAGYSVRSIERRAESLDQIRARLKPAS